MEADTGHQVTTATSYRGDDIEADTGHGWRASKGMTSTPREPPRILEATEPITTATSCQGNDIDRASNRGDQLRPAFVALLITL